MAEASLTCLQADWELHMYTGEFDLPDPIPNISANSGDRLLLLLPHKVGSTYQDREIPLGVRRGNDAHQMLLPAKPGIIIQHQS